MNQVNRLSMGKGACCTSKVHASRSPYHTCTWETKSDACVQLASPRELIIRFGELRAVAAAKRSIHPSLPPLVNISVACERDVMVFGHTQAPPLGHALKGEVTIEGRGLGCGQTPKGTLPADDVSYGCQKQAGCPPSCRFAN